MFLWQLDEAAARLSEIATAALAGAQYIEVDNDDSVVLINAKHYRLLKYSAALHAEGFIDALLSAPKGNVERDLEPTTLLPRDIDLG